MTEQLLEKMRELILEKKDSYDVNDLEEELKLLEETLKGPQNKLEIGLGSVFTLIMNGRENHYFLASTQGGTLLQLDQKTILVISIFSEFGKELLGRKTGDEFSLSLKGSKRDISVKSIQ